MMANGIKTWGCLLLLALAGCGADGLEPVGRGSAIEFNCGFAGGGATRVVTDAEFKCEWEDGDRVGVFAVEHGVTDVTSGYYIDNMMLSYSGGVWTAEDEHFWPEDGSALDFFAYYPYDPESDMADIDLVTVDVDQRGGYSADDFMTAKNDGDGLTDRDVVTLDFKHAFAMVQLTLDASMVPDGSDAMPVVTLRGVATDITMYGAAGNFSGEWVYRALVPPGSVPVGVRMFRINMADGRIFVSDPIARPVQLNAGGAETFGLELVLDDYVSEIDDPGLRAYFLSYVDDGDGVLSYDEVMAVEEIGVMDWYIESLEGIGYFKNLKKLDCGFNSIEELDLTGLTKLDELWCNDNALTELDVSGLPALRDLRCDTNLITELDVSANSELETLWCGNVGSPEMVVKVDPDLDLSSVSVAALTALGGVTRITEKNVAVHGVTVEDR